MDFDKCFELNACLDFMNVRHFYDPVSLFRPIWMDLSIHHSLFFLVWHYLS